MPIPSCTEDRTEQSGLENFLVNLNHRGDTQPPKNLYAVHAVCVSLITLGMLCGDKGLDESIGALGVEGKGVAQ